MAGRDHADYYYVKWAARATLNGEEHPVVGLTVTYELNKLPTLSLTLAVGREPTSNEEAKAATAFLEARPYSRVKVYITGETDLDSPVGTEEPGFPFGTEVMIFDGFLEGVTYRSRRSPAGGAVNLTADCVGWLGGMGGSSSSTQDNTVKGPGGFDEILNLGPEQGLFDTTNMFGVDVAGVTTDMWVQFIKQVFLAIVQSPKVWGTASNQSALDALQRMDKTSILGDANTALKFPVARAGVPEKVIQQFLVHGIGRALYNSWRSENLWSTLIRFANDFEFVVVPVIDTAFCAPVITTLGGEVYTTIGADEYHAIEYSAEAQGNVTRLVVIDANNSTSSPRDPDVKLSAVIGLANLDGILNPGDNSQGLTHRVHAPLWLAPSVAIGEYTRIGLGGDTLAIPDAVNPNAFVKFPDEQYNNIYSTYVTSQVGDDYAKLLMQRLFLAKRRGYIEGRFRLDIAPGSTVAIEVIEDKFSDPDAEPLTIVGCVSSVTLALDSGSGGSPYAATRLELLAVRTAQEHNDARITSVTHPIYDSRFAGIKLWADE